MQFVIEVDLVSPNSPTVERTASTNRRDPHQSCWTRSSSMTKTKRAITAKQASSGHRHAQYRALQRFAFRHVRLVVGLSRAFVIHSGKTFFFTKHAGSKCTHTRLFTATREYQHSSLSLFRARVNVPCQLVQLYRWDGRARESWRQLAACLQNECVAHTTRVHSGASERNKLSL